MAREFRVKAVFEGEDRGATRATRRVRKSMSDFADFVKNRFVITLGDAANAARALFATIEEVGTLESQTEALRRNLAAQGQSFDAFIAKLEEVSQAQISTADLIRTSSQALLLGIPADRIAELLEVARVSAIATGQSVEQAFNDIATGIGRASPLILDNLGLVVNLSEVYGEAASAAGTTTDALTQQQKSAALLNAVLATSAERVERFGDAQSQAASAVGRATAAFENLADGAKRVGVAFAALAAGGFAAFYRVVGFTTDTVLRLWQAIAEGLSVLPLIGGAFETAAGKIANLRDRLGDVRDTLAEYQETFLEATKELLGFSEASEGAADAVRGQTDAIRAASPAVTSYREELAKLGGETEQVSDTLQDSVSDFRTYSAGVAEGEAQVQRLTAAQQALRAELNATTSAAERQSSQFSRNVITGDRSDFATIGGGSFSRPANRLGRTTSNVTGRVNGV